MGLLIMVFMKVMQIGVSAGGNQFYNGSEMVGLDNN